ncbi:MAG: DUF2721 domain-containing protein [Proteobacteria bacterium]|nr:DUF2721 domain-containing protein [Pseudomonadota bacterium]
MNINYTVAALMFPAIPLLMSVYNNRFHTLSALIRKIHDEFIFEKHIPAQWEKQFSNLHVRIKIAKYTMMFAALGFFFNMVTVFALYLDNLYVAKIIFVSCCTSVLISIIFFIVEIHISTRALNLHMSDMDFKR